MHPLDISSVLDLAQRFEDLGWLEDAQWLYLRVAEEPNGEVSEEFKKQIRERALIFFARK